uniref:RNA-directed DNA polymerase homolog n=1 Tax=Nicotiana tabacum TaxID=4097 RepID=A0A1S3Y056_TOBAC|nr:PREDICTED: uncharacterized protein LOC107770548 [Nicotiana tabacum]
MIKAPATAPPVRTAKGGGQVSKGCPKRWRLGQVALQLDSMPSHLGQCDSVVVNRVYQSCVVTFYGFETRVYLLLLNMINFEVILSIDWFSPHHAIDNAKTITLAMPEFLRLEWRGSSSSASSWVIFFLKAQYMVGKGCLTYLAFVRDTTIETPTIDLVLMVRAIFDVFFSNLLGMPSDRDIDFDIDLALGTQPISILPYHMASAELRDLKEQLQELLKKGFIRPSVFPWDAPVSSPDIEPRVDEAQARACVSKP